MISIHVHNNNPLINHDTGVYVWRPYLYVLYSIYSTRKRSQIVKVSIYIINFFFTLIRLRIEKVCKRVVIASFVSPYVRSYICKVIKCIRAQNPLYNFKTSETT